MDTVQWLSIANIQYDKINQLADLLPITIKRMKPLNG